MGIYEVLMIILMFIFMLIGMLILTFVYEELSFYATAMISTISEVIGISLSISIIARMLIDRKHNDDRLIFNKYNQSINSRCFLYVFITMIGFILVRDALLGELLISMEGPISEKEIDALFNIENNFEIASILGLLAIKSIIIAPVLEEILFRGILLKGMLKKYKLMPIKAIIYSALIFAVAHLNLPQGINAFATGVVIGLIYYYTRSIKVVIFAHFINNILAWMAFLIGIIMKAIYIVLGMYIFKRGIDDIKEL